MFHKLFPSLAVLAFSSLFLVNLVGICSGLVETGEVG